MPGLRPATLALAILGACLLSACSHTTLVGGGRYIHIALSEYRVNPDDVRVSAGELTIYVRNYGRQTHDLVVTRNGQPTGSTKPLAPGESAALVLVLTPGKYSIASTLLSDQALGAYGTLTVTK